MCEKKIVSKKFETSNEYWNESIELKIKVPNAFYIINYWKLVLVLIN